MYSDYKILLDVPSENPAMEFGTYANAFAEIIHSSEAQFAIGIFGGWGSGKTTLMRLIEKSLDPRKSIAVQFNAWRYEKEQHLIVPLLDTIREAIFSWGQTHSDRQKQATETAASIGRVITSLLYGLKMKATIGVLDVEYDASKALERGKKFDAELSQASESKSLYHACFRALEGSLKDFVRQNEKRRIVVFVDDLDRCLPEGALSVMESMKLFFDLPGFVFVVGLDRQVVESAIDFNYRQSTPASEPESRAVNRIKGSEYIKKIFQVPFSLYPISITELDDFVKAACEATQLPNGQREEIRDVVLPHLRYIVGETGVNPREIKRYINAHVLARKLKPELEPNVSLGLQTIEFRSDWTIVRENLYVYRDHFLEALRAFVHGDPTALANLDPRLRSVPQQFLRYVNPTPDSGMPGPGAGLLDTRNIDAYLYAGEATRSPNARSAFELIRRIGRLREPLRDLSFDPTAENIDRVRGEIEPVGSIGVRLLGDSPSSGGMLALVDQLLTDLRRNLDRIKDLAMDKREEWADRNDRQISGCMSELVRWAQFG